MFIDIHVHTRRAPMPDRGGGPAYTTPEQLIERYDQMGVEKAVLLPGVNPECSYVPQSVQEVIDIAREYPDRFIPFCNVDPRAMTNSAAAPLGDLLPELRESGRITGEVFQKVARENAAKLLGCV